MARSGRIVLPGQPHHIIQRGARNQPVFFQQEDYALYWRWLRDLSRRHRVAVLGYCLLPNRIHVVALPAGEDGLRATFSTLHKEYARTVNRRMGWKGHLWQERFGSVPLDEEWAEVALRYVDLAPVRAGLAEKPEAYPFSSARGHLGRVRDGLLVQDLFLRYASTPWEQALAGPLEQEHLEKLEQHLRTLWPLGSEAFLDWIQAETGIAPRPRKPGPKPRSEREEEERGEPPAEDDFA